MTSFLPNAIRRLSWAYVAFIVFLWLFLYSAGDWWWPATMLLFAPRWFVALPVLLLSPYALLRDRRSLIPLITGGLVVAVPLMGFTISLPSNDAGESKSVRILTCNTDGGLTNLRLEALVKDLAADIVTLQECPMEVPVELPERWYMVRHGELVILSRFPLEELDNVMALHPPHKWPRDSAFLAIVHMPIGNMVICNVHLPSPRYGLQNILDHRAGINLAKTRLLIDETVNRRKAAWEVRQLVLSIQLPVIVAGDFNMPVDSNIYRESWGNFSNAFSETGFGYGYTEHAAIRGITTAVRIDHILTGNGLMPRVCKVGPDVGSDHLPLIADVALAPIGQQQ
jgi:endonuclease/exonuclease/phosphatase family metal-dependent hydrolase